MHVGKIQQSWDCSKYHLMVLSHIPPSAELAGSLPKSAEAEKTWCCSEPKASFNPRAVAPAPVSQTLFLAVSPRTLPYGEPGLELSHKSVLNGQPQSPSKPWV